MDDYTTTYAGTANEWSTPSEWAALWGEPAPVRRPAMKSRIKQQHAGALPGEAITIAISENEEQRRTLRGIFARFVASHDVSRAGFRTAESFLEALPRNKKLPKVTPDGDGGFVLAWSVPNQPRTLITLGDGMLHPVVRAGSPQAAYLPDTPFDSVIPDEVLALIPS